MGFHGEVLNSYVSLNSEGFIKFELLRSGNLKAGLGSNSVWLGSGALRFL